MTALIQNLRNPNGPPGLPLLGNLLQFRGNPFRTMREWHERYGELVQFRLGNRTFLMVNHPELAEEVLISGHERFAKMHDAAKPMGLGLVLGQGLVTSSGALWRRQRRLMQPLFQRSRVGSFENEIVAAGEELVERWRFLARQGEAVDVGRETMRATLDIITRTMFSTSVTDPLETIATALDHALRFASDHMRNPFVPPLWFPSPNNRAFKQALAALDRLIFGLIDHRRRSGDRPDDLLDRLIHARDPESGGTMSDRQIRDEAMTIFIAGHETTAVALTWACHMLAVNPGYAKELAAEVDKIASGRNPTATDLPNLVYTRAFFDETLRLYPPAVGILRKPSGPTTLGGFVVPNHALLFVNIANIQRHPEFWDDPDIFRPRRFLSGQSASTHRLAYMPFGAGSRVCLGSHFAMLESTLLLGIIARNFRLSPIDRDAIEPEIVLTLRPKGGLRVRVTER